MTELFGHGVASLFTEALIPSVAALFLYFFLEEQKDGRKLQMFFWGGLFIFFMPNAAYLGVEIRHALLKDNVADGVDIIGKVLFVILSAVGFITATVITVTAATKVNFLKRKVTVSVVGLSFLSAFGATLGVMELTSIAGLMNPSLIVEYSVYIIISWERMTFVLLLGIFLTMLGLSTKRLQEHFLLSYPIA